MPDAYTLCSELRVKRETKGKHNILRTNPTKKLLCLSNVLIITVSNIMQWECALQLLKLNSQKSSNNLLSISTCKYQRKTDSIFYFITVKGGWENSCRVMTEWKLCGCMTLGGIWCQWDEFCQ